MSWRKSVQFMVPVAVGTNLKSHFRFPVNFNADSFLALLKQLFCLFWGRMIHLLDDNGDCHKGSEVMQRVEKNSGRTELHFGPPYSPDLNAAECVWKATRGKTTLNRFFPTVDHRRAKLFRRFDRVQGNPASLRNALASLT
ncbi:MAG: transposase [Deltaproteobacteria bacterium]